MLLLRPDHLGDVLLTSPAIQLLRDSLPHAHLTYLVGPWSADVARCGPAVDELRTLEFPGFNRTRRPAAHLAAPYALLLRQALQLKRERYDAAVVLRPDHWWGALLAAVAGIPLRLGTDTPETRPLLTHALSEQPREHTADQAIRLARLVLHVLGLEVEACADADLRQRFEVPEPARQRAGAFWTANGLHARRVAVVQPTAGAALKSWPIECWVELADRLSNDFTVLLTGAPGDAELLENIRRRCQRPPLVLSGQSLVDSAAVYERASLLVGLDGGGAHIAAAVGTPTVRLYGPAPLGKFGPWPARDDQRVLVTRNLACVPCGHLEHPPCGATRLPACLLALSVHDVMREVRDLPRPRG